MSEPPATTAPLLSVIVPSYNQGPYLRECLESILRQDYRPIEVIVVDGASRDETVDVLRSYSQVPELRWVSEPDDGPASAVNKGLAMARGALATIQSSDDYYLPGAFRRAVAEFLRDPALGLVYGECLTVDRQGRRLNVSRRPPHDNALCIALGVCIPLPSAFFSAPLARELGGWRSQYHTCDWDLWLRMMFRTRALKVDEPLAAWRVYEGQRTDQRARVYESFCRMLDESEEIRSGGRELRRAAQAGKRVMAVSYAARRDAWARLGHLLAATVLFPRVLPWVPRKKRFVPGYQAARDLARRAMRQLRRGWATR